MKVYTVFYRGNRGIILFKRIKAIGKLAARQYVQNFLHVTIVSVE